MPLLCHREIKSEYFTLIDILKMEKENWKCKKANGIRYPLSFFMDI